MFRKFKAEHPALYNLITRALWTFLQAFLGALIILPSMDKKALYGAIIGAVGAGLSAVKTLVLDYLEHKLEQKDEADA
jgi:hypothetical protein